MAGVLGEWSVQVQSGDDAGFAGIGEAVICATCRN